MSQKIRLQDLRNYVEAHKTMLQEGLGIASPHLLEQVAYRMELCKDTCVPNGKCKNCGCTLPGRLYASESCNNGEIFPDLMSRLEWDKFKETINEEEL